MRMRNRADRAAMWLGAVSLASLLFLIIKRELHFVDIPKAGIAVAVVFGLMAIAGGWLANRAVTMAAGIGFLAAAVLQVVLQTVGSSYANGSNGSTMGLWLGLGAALVTVGLTRREA